MIINYSGKYTDFKWLFHKCMLKIMHIFHQEINNHELVIVIYGTALKSVSAAKRSLQTSLTVFNKFVLLI